MYFLRLVDGSLYCGCSNDVEGRLRTHRAGRGSRLVRARLPAELAYVEVLREGGRAAAQMREAEIKRYSKIRKEALCAAWKNQGGDSLLGEKREQM